MRGEGLEGVYREQGGSYGGAYLVQGDQFGRQRFIGFWIGFVRAVGDAVGEGGERKGEREGGQRLVDPWDLVLLSRSQGDPRGSGCPAASPPAQPRSSNPGCTPKTLDPQGSCHRPPKHLGSSGILQAPKGSSRH